jgi:hypothetical protein
MRSRPHDRTTSTDARRADDPPRRSREDGIRPRLRVLRGALRERGAAPGLQDELATVIRLLHDKLGLDEGGVV